MFTCGTLSNIQKEWNEWGYKLYGNKNVGKMCWFLTFFLFFALLTIHDTWGIKKRHSFLLEEISLIFIVIIFLLTLVSSVFLSCLYILASLPKGAFSEREELLFTWGNSTLLFYLWNFLCLTAFSHRNEHL